MEKTQEVIGVEDRMGGDWRWMRGQEVTKDKKKKRTQEVTKNEERMGGH